MNYGDIHYYVYHCMCPSVKAFELWPDYIFPVGDEHRRGVGFSGTGFQLFLDKL